jgi:predicted nucleotidyltransferase
VLPDNTEVEHEVRRHLSLFAATTHPALLAALRRTAAELMRRLADFNPHLVGAVLGGTATEHSDIELHLFSDSAKDVEVALMNAGIDFDCAGRPRIRFTAQVAAVHGFGASQPAAAITR